MSGTWAHTRASFKRLSDGLREADEDTRWDFGFWLTGLAMMAGAIIIQFGLLGFLFCGGAVIWASANSSITNRPRGDRGSAG